MRRPLLASLAGLHAALRTKAEALSGVIKVGRTHLQDAAPVTFGQEFGARVVAVLARRLDAPFVVADNLFAAMAGHEALVGLHGALRTLAVALNKIANDIRLMGSGPRAGRGELRLPANEPGSSMMPGKVNPTQVAAMTMVRAQVTGHDVAIGIAASQGQFELNVYKPLIAYDLLDSLRLLADAMASLRVHCIEGIEVDVEHARLMLAHSLLGVTALVPRIGYDHATRIARHAYARGLDLRQAALEVGGVSAAEYDAWVDVQRMLAPG